jgi:hypothetical protein
MVLWFVFCIIMVFVLMFLEQWRTDKKRLIFLRKMAKQFGIDELNPHKDLYGDLFSTGVSLNGRWNAIKVALGISSASNGIEVSVELNALSSTRLKIRRPRHFFNRNLVELITKTSELKVKFQTSTDHVFEVFSDDPSNVIRIFERSSIKPRLELCIAAQEDMLEIDGNRILVNVSSLKFFWTTDWDEIEEKFVQMWFLATDIAAVLPTMPKTDINLLKCPYCRGMLNEGVRIVVAMNATRCFTKVVGLKMDNARFSVATVQQLKQLRSSPFPNNIVFSI